MSSTFQGLQGYKSPTCSLPHSRFIASRNPISSRYDLEFLALWASGSGLEVFRFLGFMAFGGEDGIGVPNPT